MTNTRFEDLEKRAKALKVKQYIKVFVVLSTLLAIGYYVISIKQLKKVDNPLHVNKTVKMQEPKPTPKVQKYEAVIQAKPEPKAVEKKIIVEKKEIQYDTIKLSPTINLGNKETLETKSNEEIKIEKEPKRNKISLKVKEVKSEEALLERFKVAGDFESAMGLANLYFEEKKFEKSIYWSRKASKLTSGDEIAWLVYAKSKHALSKTDEAIKALQLYLEYFSSEEIEKLLKLYRNKK